MRGKYFYKLDLSVEGRDKVSLQKHLLQAVKDLIDGNNKVDTKCYSYNYYRVKNDL